MALNFLQETNQTILADIQIDLSFIDNTIDLNSLSQMSVHQLNRELATVTESIATMKAGVYGSWLNKEEYVRDTLIEEAIKVSIDEKHKIMKTDTLIPGATYYTNVVVENNIIDGYKALFMGNRFTGWMKITESAPIAKALQIMRHGNEADFRELYVGIADGHRDALNTLSMGHITESSDAALLEMDAYCDARWDGAWPWELEAPDKLKYMIETREEMNMKLVEEMQADFAQTLREFDEGTMDKFEMVTSAQAMMKRVDSMISDFGKLSSDGIEIMAQVKANGDDHLVKPMQDALGEPLNNAIDALTTLKASLTRGTATIAGHDHSAGDGHHHSAGNDMPPMGGDMGSPMDAMGSDPMGGEDPIDNIDIGDGASERPIKEI